MPNLLSFSRILIFTSLFCFPSFAKVNPRTKITISENVNTKEKLKLFFAQLHNKYKFNGNVLIAKKGEIIYEGSFGWTSFTHQHKLNINTQFQLASVSKPFTAVAILMLCETGKIKLNQTVTHFFPNFPYPNITIHHLLTHQSGLTNYVYFCERVWRNQQKPLNNQIVMDLFNKYNPGKYFGSPGAHFHYNNSNYMILAAILEKVTGKTYQAFMKEKIFKPCGMTQSIVLTTNNKQEYNETMAKGHDRTWRYCAMPNYLDGTCGDKGIYSTVGDLYRFDKALKQGLLLKKSTLNKAYQPYVKKEHGYFSYGYGWRTFDRDNIKIVYHTGWWHGFRNFFMRDLTNDVTIILLSNLVNGSLNHTDQLFEILKEPIIRRGAY